MNITERFSENSKAVWYGVGIAALMCVGRSYLQLELKDLGRKILHYFGAEVPGNVPLTVDLVLSWN